MATSQPIRLALAGATGKTGRLVAEAATEASDIRLDLCILRQGSPDLGRAPSKVLPIPEGADAPALVSIDHCNLHDVDVLVDFSVAGAAVDHARMAHEHGCGLVIGTTGLNGEQLERIASIAQSTPILVAANTSIGINLLHRLVKTACANLPKGFEVEIIEAHHRHKADAPSGTALALGKSVCEAQGKKLEDAAVYGRAPSRPGKRSSGEIGFSSVRGGDIVGEHTVMFVADGERIELTHKGANRSIYALGALEAARYVHAAKPGMYGMDDIFGQEARVCA